MSVAGPVGCLAGAGQEGMTIGIEQFRTRRDLWIDRLLLQPFRGPASGYPINREADERDGDRHP